MSQIGVVHYSHSASKINVLQQNNAGNKPIDRQIIVLRKQPLEAGSNNVSRKKQKPDAEGKTNTQPVAVARRNARERNRVKQVNDGFANLRQHIPNVIAAAFENSSGRGGNKKLSKVETLRMAVEYIKSLESILAMDQDKNKVGELSYSSSSPASHNHQDVTYTYQLLSPPEEDDDMSSAATPPPQQFIKLDSSNSFQLLPTNAFYENGENVDPIRVSGHILSDSDLLNSNLELPVCTGNLQYLHNTHTDSLSPGFYSENSMSPNNLENEDQSCFVPVFNMDLRNKMKIEITDIPVISLKTEQEIPDEHKENIVDVLQWWEQQPQNDGS